MFPCESGLTRRFGRAGRAAGPLPGRRVDNQVSQPPERYLTIAQLRTFLIDMNENLIALGDPAREP